MVLERLSILADEVSERFLEALDWAMLREFRYVELRRIDGTDVADLSDAQVARANHELEERRLRVSALASSLFRGALDPLRIPDGGEPVEAHFRKLPRVLRIAKALGTGRIRIFSFRREKQPERYAADIVRHLERAAGVAEREGVVLLLESDPACNGGSAEEVAALVRRTGSPALRVLWDPDLDGVAAVKGLFDHVHWKDPAIGRRLTPIKEQIMALERDGYRGLYTLEPHSTPMQGTEEAIDGLRGLLRGAGLA